MPEQKKMGSGKKFSITIQVPDDVTGQWPERATAEKLVQEVYTAMGAQPAVARPAAPAPRAETPPARRSTLPILLALFAGGVIGGYLGARGFLEFALPSSQSVTAPPAVSAPARPAPSAQATTPSASPPVDLSGPPAPAADLQPSPPIVLPPVTGPAAGAPTAVYNVQVGAYRLQRNAEALVDQMRQDGFKAHVVPFSGLYLVQMGTFQTRAEADRVVAKLKAQHYEAFIVQLTSSGNLILTP